MSRWVGSGSGINCINYGVYKTIVDENNITFELLCNYQFRFAKYY